MRKIRTVMLVSGLLAATLLVGTPARAATITVTTTVDEWDAGGGGGERSSDLGSGCGLREAIHAAEVNAAFGGCPAGAPGHDEIVVPAGTYPLNVIPNGTEESAGDLNIASDVTITGAGPSQSIIDALRLDAVMEITNTAVTLEGLTLRNGFAEAAAGLYTDSSVVVLRNVAVRDSEAGMNTGGGIYAFESDLTILDSTISGNRAASQGGGIASFNSELSLDGVALSDNFVQGPNADGGGILALGSSLTAVNTTLSGNRAPDDGGGIYIATTDVSLRNATLTKNVADEDADNSGNGGGIENVDGTVTVANSIVAENEDRTQGVGEGRDCSGNLTSQGYNVIGYNGDCTFTPATGDQVGTAFPENLLDPELGPLTGNGGPTETHALLPGSPALDNGSPERTSELRACEPTDQRGVPRPQGTGCDVGAYE
ncbi:MAG: choice-of-anchor Q domain-containing protein, partial [Actinomycetota bacterium]